VPLRQKAPASEGGLYEGNDRIQSKERLASEGQPYKGEDHGARLSGCLEATYNDVFAE
jgi:hypothetical protein